MKKAAMAGALGFGLLIALLLSMFLIIASDEDSGGSGSGLYIGVNLSAEVLAHQPMVEKYARQNGISVMSMFSLPLFRWKARANWRTLCSPRNLPDCR